jgi:hypothetical protein
MTAAIDRFYGAAALLLGRADVLPVSMIKRDVAALLELANEAGFHTETTAAERAALVAYLPRLADEICAALRAARTRTRPAEIGFAR